MEIDLRQNRLSIDKQQQVKDKEQWVDKTNNRTSDIITLVSIKDSPTTGRNCLKALFQLANTTNTMILTLTCNNSKISTKCLNSINNKCLKDSFRVNQVCKETYNLKELWEEVLSHLSWTMDSKFLGKIDQTLGKAALLGTLLLPEKEFLSILISSRGKS